MNSQLSKRKYIKVNNFCNKETNLFRNYHKFIRNKIKVNTKKWNNNSKQEGIVNYIKKCKEKIKKIYNQINIDIIIIKYNQKIMHRVKKITDLLGIFKVEIDLIIIKI